MIKNKQTFLILGSLILFFIAGVSIFLSTQRGGLPGKKTAVGKEAGFFITAETDTFRLNQPEVLKLILHPNTNQGIVIASADLLFDPQILEVTNVSGSDQFSNQIMIEYDNQEGLITVKQGLAGGEEAVVQELVFAEIEFMPISETGSSIISFSEEETSIVSTEARYLGIETPEFAFKVGR